MPDETPAPHRALGDVVARLRNVSVRRQGRPILNAVDWQVGRGERWVLLGPNGSGKTTLLSVTGMQLLPTEGTVQLLGEESGRTDTRLMRQRVAFVSQSTLRALRPSLLTHDVVLTGRYAALEPWWHDYSERDNEDARSLLEEAGLGDVGDRPFGVLSEGERQRALVARALMGRPELLLLDEPAAGLDLGAREQLVARLAELAADAATPPMVLVTHHTEEIPPGTTHAALLRNGDMIAAGPVDEVLVAPLVSAAFDTPVKVEVAGGRWFARATPGALASDAGLR